MKIVIGGKHLEMTEPIKEYVSQRFQNNKKYINIVETSVTLSSETKKSEGKKFIAQATVYAPEKAIRIEEEHDDLYALLIY